MTDLQTPATFPPADGVARDIESWRTLIWGGLPPFHSVAMRDRESSFSGRITRNFIGPVSTHRVEVHGKDHLAVRTKQHIGSGASPAYVVIQQLTGTSEIRLDAAPVQLEPGDLSIWLSTTPYRWHCPSDATVFMIIFPRELIGVPPRGIAAALGTTLRPESAYGHAVSKLVSVTASDISLLSDPFAGRHIRNLIDVIATNLLRTAAAHDPREGSILVRISQFIEHNLGDPELSIELIARAHFVSVRYLQKLFHGDGTTVSAWIRESRLQRAYAQLLDPSSAQLTIAAVAAHWGFSDHSYFSRAFRRRFGMSPLECRRTGGTIPTSLPSSSDAPGLVLSRTASPER